MNLLMSSRTLSHILRVSSRFHGRSLMSMSPIEQSGSPLGDGGSPDVLVSHSDVEPPFSPIAQDQDLVSVGSPDVGLLVSPLVDISTDSVSAVIRPLSQLPTVDNLFAQDRLWAPIAVPSPDVGDRRETPAPRWRLAREGPFLAKRSPESIRSLGAGCAFRNTSYRSSDYDAPSGGVWTACASSAVP